MYLVIFAAIAPVVVLLWQILKRDSANPEPPKMLMKAFFYGMVSTVVTFIFRPITEVIGDITMLDDYPHAQAFKQGIFSAALPEEGAKLLMLWL
uniref:PrsW family glutamic-type intramembrane protease n=1 Tax=Prevotella sp. TaxID=59823 RepID=UPI003FEFE45F